ncbi:L-aspartate oxidase [Phormidium sp. FACHB-1136]|uniref:L-aspartate oxidase n=1 Tax=Phormidium sp. FACHB-1136 TaxID=2692848 RepID=UPI0018EFDB2A|nr:L-aspartate oxidase [Phormidium sp. FACHB-1136]
MAQPIPSPAVANPPWDFDVLVVGGGAAGLYAALSIPERWRVGLITKDNLSLSASDWAQGGIAAALGSDDSTSLHVADTLRAGAGLCELDAVEHLVTHAATCIHRLVDLGVAFDRSGPDLAMTLEAAHSRKRVLHAADTTGRAIVSILAETVLQRPNIIVYESAFALDLWLEDGHCRGISLVQGHTLRWISAQATVLATGGGGQVYAQTTNPAASTGDGVAMVWRAGGQLRDLEFFQFHPTSLSQAGAPPFLISEAVRGEGAHLVDKEGRRFAYDYHPDGELAPRDVVSRAIFHHLQKTGDRQVWLDMRPIPADHLNYRFPNIIRVCRTWGCDPLTQPVPVAPAAHYWMGGIPTNCHSQTQIPGLYAVGENSSTGVHGANRLASNSLLECLVYGAELANLPLQEGLVKSDLPTPLPPQSPEAESHPDPRLAVLEQQRQQLTQLMWDYAAISRHQTGLETAIATLADWRKEAEQSALNQTLQNLTPEQPQELPDQISLPVLRAWGELRNLYDIAWLVLNSARFRTESRGGHYRSDYPNTDPAWQAHTLVQGNQWQRSAPVSAQISSE